MHKQNQFLKIGLKLDCTFFASVIDAYLFFFCSTKEVSRFHTPFIVEKLQQLALHRENLAVVCKESWLAFLEYASGQNLTKY